MAEIVRQRPRVVAIIGKLERFASAAAKGIALAIEVLH
jgi:hypothetical protein